MDLIQEIINIRNGLELLGYKTGDTPNESLST